MSAIDDAVSANRQHSWTLQPQLAAAPAKHLTVVTCMDTRLDLLPALGLHIGEAHFLRNAGGLVTDDVLRSLAISQRALGTREVAVIHHTKCGMLGFDDEAFRSELMIETDQRPPWNVPGFDDVHEQARRSLDRVRGCGWLPHRDEVRAFVLDVDSGLLSEAA